MKVDLGGVAFGQDVFLNYPFFDRSCILFLRCAIGSCESRLLLSWLNSAITFVYVRSARYLDEPVRWLNIMNSSNSSRC